MKTTVFVLSFLALSAAGADEYELKIVGPSSSKNLEQSCQKQVISVVLQTFEVKSGPTYERCPLGSALANYIRSSSVKLNADPNLPSCANEAARTDLNTLMIRQGECLATNVSVLGLCSLDSADVVYSAASLLSSDLQLPASEISNLKVKMTVELPKLKLSVSFDERSLHPYLYNYKLQFDGQTADVNNGSEMLVDLTTCFDLQFTLTPYIQDRESGDSVVYQFPIAEVPPPVVDVQAIAYTNKIPNIIISWENIVKADPCETMLGYEIELLNSRRGDPNATLLYTAGETNAVLSCEETSDYAGLKISVRTIAGVGAPESFEGKPGLVSSGYLGDLTKYFDKQLQACVFAFQEVKPSEKIIACTSSGGRPFDRPQIMQGVENNSYGAWIPLSYDNSASEWRWQDGTVLSSTDPLWQEGFGGPNSTLIPAFKFSTGKIYLRGYSAAFHACFI